MHKYFAAAATVATGAFLAHRVIRNTRKIDFRGRSVVIAGGSRGLGLIMARQLAAQRAQLTLLARDEAELQRAVFDVAGRAGNVCGIVCDIADQDQVQQAIDQIIQSRGRIDVLINNAGAIQVGPIDHMTVDDFRLAMDTHLYGPLYAMLAVIPHMRVNDFGRIVNISSIGGKVGVPHLVPYCASKFALTGLSDSIRAELAQDNILVTTVIPGLMRTGSPPNALFKGRHHEEYTWFTMMDACPVTSISAQRAARKIIEAARHGDPQLTISIQAKLAVFLNTIAPGLSAQGTKLMNALLPDVSLVQDKESFTGWESRTNLAPSVLTKPSDEATQENNQIPTTALAPA